VVSLTVAATLALLLAPEGSADLSAAAAASGRPRECAAPSRRAARKVTVWEVARAPSLARYCDLLARAQAQLASAPEQAKATALEADAAVGGRAAPAVVMARAALALGDAQEAARSFATARARDARSVEEPNALYDLARTLRATGKLDEALQSYRALVPRLDLLSTTERKVGALLEAAHVAMAAPAAAGAAPARAEEAAAWLREARQRPMTALAGDVALSLALALDRSGDRLQADAALVAAAQIGARVTGKAYLATADDALALEALAREAAGDDAGAIKGWAAFVATPAGQGHHGGAARARLDALRRGRGAVSVPAHPRPAKGSR
jgi:hypothetical protein